MTVYQNGGTILTLLKNKKGGIIMKNNQNPIVKITNASKKLNLKALLLTGVLSVTSLSTTGCLNTRIINTNSTVAITGSVTEDYTDYPENGLISGESLESIAIENAATTGTDDLLNLKEDKISVQKTSNGSFRQIPFREAVSLLWRFTNYYDYIESLNLETKKLNITYQEELDKLGEFSNLHPDIMYTKEDTLYTQYNNEEGSKIENIYYPDYDEEIRNLVTNYMTTTNQEEKDKALKILLILKKNYEDFIEKNGIIITKELLVRVVKANICNTLAIPISNYNQLDTSEERQIYKFTDCYIVIDHKTNNYIYIPIDNDLGRAISLYYELQNPASNISNDLGNSCQYAKEAFEIANNITSNAYESNKGVSADPLVKEIKKR